MPEPVILEVFDPLEKERALVADFSHNEFPTIQNFPHPSQRSIMPLVALYGDEVRPLGTCFAVTNHGLVLTARRVIEECFWPSRDEDKRAGPWSLAAVYVAKPTANDHAADVPDLLGGILNANKIHFGDRLDLAAVHLNLPINTESNALLRMPALRLNPAIPSMGDVCFGLGYHSMSWNLGTDGKHTHEVVQSYSASRGKIEEVHFPARDSAVIKFPAFRTSARFDKGMSGGPVFNEAGDVVGAVCSSFVNDGDYISYTSLIGPALFLQVNALTVSGAVEPKFLYDFAVGGSLVLNYELGSLKVLKHTAAELEIDFGRLPTLRGTIEPDAEINGQKKLEGKH